MSPHMREMQSLCRRLELGLIFVGFTQKGIPQVDVSVHPKEASAPRRDKKRRLAVIREHENRTGSVNEGGVTHKKILTAYKEQALLVGRILRECGHARVEDVKRMGGPANTGTILGRNVLGWFDRELAADGRKYWYRVNQKGLEALELYEDIL